MQVAEEDEGQRSRDCKRKLLTSTFCDGGKMTLFASKSGSQPETFGVFKQKLGKQHSWGFKQHFTSTTVNQEQKQSASCEKKSEKRGTIRTSISVPEDLDRNVDEKRGFVPSDVNDPAKREFLSQLSKRIFTEQRAHNLFAKIRVLGHRASGNPFVPRSPISCVVMTSTECEKGAKERQYSDLGAKSVSQIDTFSQSGRSRYPAVCVTSPAPPRKRGVFRDRAAPAPFSRRS